MSPASRVAPGARLRGRALLRPVVALVALGALAGCVSEREEVEIGSQLASNLNARVPLVQDAPLNLYVNDLGRMIARHSERPDLDYHFYIIDTPAVNAFALPGGYVYVDRGLIERTHTVSELAGVLAHEIAHVALRHGAKNLQRQIRTSSMSNVLWRRIVGRAPPLNQQALQLGTEVWRTAHSRSDETSADQEAVKYLNASGIDPEGMVALFNDLMKEERSEPATQTVEWLSSHPTTSSRLAVTQQTIAADMPKPTPRLATNNASYPLFLARMQMLPPPPPLVQLPEN